MTDILSQLEHLVAQGGADMLTEQSETLPKKSNKILTFFYSVMV